MKTVLLLLLLIAGALGSISNTVFELDGNAYNNSLVTDDWSSLHSGSGSSRSYSGVIEDPAPLSTFRTGGSKDTNDITSWRYGDSSVPDKDDILNSFAASYVVNGSVHIYFGADRFANDGDASVGFWFFQDDVQLLENGRFTGAHRNGDILVLANFGSDQSINIYKWQDGEPVLAFSDTNARCNSELNQVVCAITNDVELPSPWPYTPKSGTPGFFPPQSFIEGGVNLNELFGSTTSIPCFTSFMVVSRSSTSITSQLKDFALGDFRLCSIDGRLSCDSATIDPSKTRVDYGYSITVENNGFGNLYNLTVNYNGLTVYTQALLTPGETVNFDNTFSDDGTSTQPVQTGTLYVKAYLTPELDENNMFEIFEDSQSCPTIPLVPEATISVGCVNITVNEVDERYIYDYDISVANTGFGNLTIYEFGVYSGALVDLLEQFTSRVLTPTGSSSSLSAYGSLESDTPITNMTGLVNFVTFNGSHLVKEDTSGSCPTVLLTPGISVNKTCTTNLLDVGNLVAVHVNYSGSICNTGNIRIKNVTLVENADGFNPRFVMNLSSMDKGTCVDYNDDYYPNSINGSYTFSDSVSVNANAILNLGSVGDSASASCDLCA